MNNEPSAHTDKVSQRRNSMTRHRQRADNIAISQCQQEQACRPPSPLGATLRTPCMAYTMCLRLVSRLALTSMRDAITSKTTEYDVAKSSATAERPKI